MKKVFVIAMDCEAEAVVRCLSDVRRETMFGRKVIRGTLGGEQTAVISSGIGKANAAAGAQLALSSLGAEVHALRRGVVAVGVRRLDEQYVST